MPMRRFLAADSVWHREVGDDIVAQTSPAQVARLVEVMQNLYNGNAAFNVYQYGVSWYTVGPGQARTDVAYWNCQGKPTLPEGLTGPDGQFVDVPIPPDAVPTPGTDASLSIYQPSTDTLWDFWKTYRDEDGWHACWGGRIDRVSRSNGAFESHFGASASGLAREAGVVSINEARRGVIGHALALSLPASLLADGWVFPAQRGDGSSTSPEAIPEGSRLRLDPLVDIDSLRLTPLGRIVAHAAQRYGFIVTDRAATVAVSAEGPYAYRARAARDPWVELLDGVPPSRVLAGFPWLHLQVLVPELPSRGKPSA